MDEVWRIEDIDRKKYVVEGQVDYEDYWQAAKA